jgi:hypothetical protein
VEPEKNAFERLSPGINGTARRREKLRGRFEVVISGILAV